MIEAINSRKSLQPFLSDECRENRCAAEIDESIKKENITIIKVDDYYNSLKLGDTPPSVDGLITVLCADGSFRLFLVELKDIKTPKNFKVDDVYNKFKTTIIDFMSERYKDIFLDKKYQIDNLLLKKPFRFRGKLYQISHKLPNPLITNK